MAEKKPVVSRSEETLNAGERTIRSYEEALTTPPPPATPTQEELDAIKEGTYEHEAVPQDETQEQRQKREEDKRQRREAKAQADQQANYQTR